MQHLYLSYPENDYGFAHRLVEDLQAAGYPVFVDAVSSVGTMAWAAETRHAIRTCGAMLMVLSPADGRRIGIRHEGILARRRRKLVCVIRRSPGELPRYLQDATVIDVFDDHGDSYDRAWAQLSGALPPAADLLKAGEPVPAHRRPRRPPRPAALARRRRRLVMVVIVLAMIVACVVSGIALGVIPV
jgi:hypothetical protein